MGNNHSRRGRRRAAIILGMAMLMGLRAVPAAADGFWDTVNGMWASLCAPNTRLDTEFVFQPRKGWEVASGYEMRSNFMQLSPRVDFSGDPHLTSRAMDLQIGPSLSHLASAQVTYGPVTLGLSKAVGSAFKTSKFNSLNYFSDSYAFDIRYSNITSIPECTVTEGSGAPVHVAAEYPARVKTLVINGVYAFSKKYSYKAVYSGRAVQRRSHGSWLLAAKYTRGRIILDPQDSKLLTMGMGYGRFVTDQISLGGGYSFNWVLWHRDAQGPADLRSLRNLTFNVTVTPLLTFYNSVANQQYRRPYVAFPPESVMHAFTDEIYSTNREYGRIQPNFTARAGFVWHLGQFYLTAWSDFTHFVLAGRAREFNSAWGSGTFSQSGSFANWSLAVKLNYRF